MAGMISENADFDTFVKKLDEAGYLIVIYFMLSFK